VGRFADHVIAFARAYGCRYSITVVPRWLTKVVPEGDEPLGTVWEDTAITMPEGSPAVWTNTMTGERCDAMQSLPVEHLFKRFPAALLIGETGTGFSEGH
jgi:(1->4)-alpha-D-glucan 1-alpha-D-glucosylmutase